MAHSAAHEFFERVLSGNDNAEGAEKFSGQQRDALLAISLTVSILSAFGSGFIVFSYYRLEALRSMSAFDLIVFLSVADIFSAVVYFFGNPKNTEGLCDFQAFGIQFFQMSSILWTAAISSTLYRQIVMKLQDQKDHALPVHYYHAMVWGTSFVLALLPFTTNSYGPTGGWCWVQATSKVEFDTGTAWRYFIFYVPLWGVIAYNAIMYYYITKTLSNFSSDAAPEMSKKLNGLISRLRMYPVILIVCYGFATINRLQNSFDPKNPVFALYVLHSLFQSAQGLFNAMVYGMTPAVISAWKSDSVYQRMCSSADQLGGDEAENPTLEVAEDSKL